MRAYSFLVNFLWSIFFSGIKTILTNQRGSFSVPVSFVEGFRTNIHMLSQQKGPRLWGKGRNESQAVETDFFERIESTDVVDIVDRHGDTPINNTIHSRRAVTLEDAEWGDLIDRKDKLRMLIRPTSSYVRNAVWAFNRKKDDVFIAAALGPARAGKKGELTVNLADEDKLVAVDEGTGLASNLNVFTITRVAELFDDADIDEELIRYFAISSSQKQSLLRDTEVTSSDFNTVKTLTTGNINQGYMGFLWTRSQRLPVTAATTKHDPDGTVNPGGPNTAAAGGRRCIAWIEDGMISSHGEDMFIDVGPRRDKRMSIQVYATHSVGAVRMEEAMVKEIICTE